MRIITGQNLWDIYLEEELFYGSFRMIMTLNKTYTSEDTEEPDFWHHYATSTLKTVLVIEDLYIFFI